MKVLIVSQHFWPETFRINEVAESLREAGCSVSVLTGQPNYPDGQVFPGYRAGSLGREEHAGFTIHRVPLVPRGRGGARQLVANYLSFLASACILGPWMLRGRKFDVIFVYGTSPILQAMAGVVLRLVKRAALVTWVQDLWPQSLEVTGFVRNARLLRAVAAVVSWIYRRSDLLLVQSHAFVPTVRAMAGRTPVEYHPNPGERAFSEPPTEAAPALALDDGFNVVFAGNLGTVQSLETIVEAAALLKMHRDVRFVVIGSGSRGDWLERTVAERGLDNVQLPGRFPPQAMPRILEQASALLITLARGEILSQTVPSKMQAYLASGRPIIASLDGEGQRVLNEAGAGMACPAEDPAALAEAVLKLRNAGAEELGRMGDAGRRYYVEHFDPVVLAEQLVDRFRALSVARK
jgi:glycosyltransferase involved in cell wall biosynthesis